MAFLLALLAIFFSVPAFATASNANVLKINTAVTNITTGAYVQLSASTPILTGKIVVTNQTSSIIIIAFGAAGSEVGIFAINATSNAVIPLSVILPSTSRISLEAVDATASSGWVTVSLLQ